MNKQVEDVFVRVIQPKDEVEARQALWSLELTIDALERSSSVSRSVLVKALGQFLTDNCDKV